MSNLFGEHLKKLRFDRKMTLRDVEKKSKLLNSYISQVENGKRSIPTIRNLNKLAVAYGVTLSQLLEAASNEVSKKNKSISTPDADFIFYNYKKLSKNNKQILKKFLEYLISEEKYKKTNSISQTI